MALDTGTLLGLLSGVREGADAYQGARREKRAEESEAARMGMEREKLGLMREQNDFERQQKQAAQRSSEFTDLAKSGYTPQYDEKGLLVGKTADPDYWRLQARSRDQLDPYKAMRLDEMQRKRDEDELALQVPGVGKALTKEDAKALKEASQSKEAFDQKINEMIALRKKYGGEFFNREAVERGKQLSKDLLLEYKNMQKLGVLSKADEDIINAIIPADPLEFQTAGLIGQDPIMNRLEKFKGDAERNYQTGLGLRLRSGTQQVAQQQTAAVPNRDAILAEIARRKQMKAR